MKLKKVQLSNFKRFTDLTIDQIPATSKLVLLIGANGSGKSCVFDAFNFCYFKSGEGRVRTTEDYMNYFKKSKNSDSLISLIDSEDNTFQKAQILKDGILKPSKVEGNKFYGRTSFRQFSRINSKTLGDSLKTNDYPVFFIDRDLRFKNDLENIYKSLMKDLFKDDQGSKEIKEKYILPINRALENIFGNANGNKLKLLELIPPLDGEIAQVTFEKGEHQFHYNYLSAGEKEVFNILINLLSRSPEYQDTIYYIDELDLHLNTKLQFNLIKEITENWIPENCQLWTASHSLGFIEYARQSKQASIIDFDDLDFDLPQVLTPVPKENPEVYEIAVGKEFLSSLFKNMKVFFVENKDQVYYSSVGVDKTVFVSEKDRYSVFYKTVNTDFYGLVDRDWLSDDDIEQIKKHYPNLSILHFYSIENYLYHPENLASYYKSIENTFDREDYIKLLTQEKNKIVDSLTLRFSSVRSSYPYFNKPKFNGKPLQNRFRNKEENFAQAENIGKNLRSNTFEVFYPVLPMKDYCTNLPQRQNVAKTSLAKTKWFKTQIEKLLSEK